MIVFIRPEHLVASYELAIAAYPAAVRVAIEGRLHEKKSLFLYSFWARRVQMPSSPDDLILLTKKTWGAFLGRDISDGEAHVIIAAFSDLGDLLREIKDKGNAASN